MMVVRWGNIDAPILFGPEAQDKIREAAKEEYAPMAAARDRRPKLEVILMMTAGGDSAVHSFRVTEEDMAMGADEVLNLFVREGLIHDGDIATLRGDAQDRYAESAVMASMRIHNKHWKAAKAKVRKERHDEGLGFVLDPKNDVSLFRFSSIFFSVGIGVHRLSRFDHNIAVCFCTPEDEWSDQTARGLLGYRLAHSVMQAVSYDSLILSPAEAAERALYRMIIEAESKDSKVCLPMFFTKACRGEKIKGVFRISPISLVKRGTKAAPKRPPKNIADA